MTLSLVKDRILPERVRARTSLVDPEVLALQWSDIHEWAWIKRDGEVHGAMGLIITQNIPEDEKHIAIEETNYTLIQNFLVTATILGIPQRIRTRVTMDLTPDFRIEKFIARARASIFQVECQGFVRDKVLYYQIRNLSLHVKNNENAPAIYGYMELDDNPLSLLEAVKPMMARYSHRLVGETYSFDAFNPFGSQTSRKVIVTVASEETLVYEGQERKVYRVDTKYDDITRSSWVDEFGRTLRREILMGYIAEQGGRANIIKAFPKLGEELEVPEFDELDFMRKAILAGPAPELLDINGSGIADILGNL